MTSAPPPGRPSPLGRVRSGIRRFRAGHHWGPVSEFALWQRSLGFASLAFLTLVPLLIVVSAAGAGSGQGFAQWLGDALGVSEAAREEIGRLFALPGQVRRTTTAFGLALLAVFGLSFGTVVQSGYEKVWDLPPARWRARWRHVLWLAVLIGTLYLFAVSSFWRGVPVRGALTLVGGTLFFWWSQRLLLGGRVAWPALLPGALATVLGLFGLRVFSRFVFSPLIASSAVTYGPFGAFLVIQTWLVAVGVVVFGGALAGRLLADELPRATDGLRPWRR
ncbi:MULTISPECIES: YhjD/YihY/BrkB family envelope integrity protein [Streptomyces]|uniref:Ribonuclease BN n=1 Tax=Streptomyces venezuelae TaxID=54571 RepID=A0A5P2B3R7_STRVZ|nr:YhjD/YihY/BrkB family envelope integrity protein [Streptomyces venezuelae]QES23801.1 ribonuclease BN [Streptomyces venezuelae]